MNTRIPMLPDGRTLQAGLKATFDFRNGDERSVTILERRPPQLTSTFPNEVVTFRLARRRRRRVFVKYGAGLSHDAFGHRGGIAYEAEIYRRVLSALPGFRPKFLGAHTDSKNGGAWLFLEYVDRCERASDLRTNLAVRLPRVMTQVARWLGKFHAAHEGPAAEGRLAFLKCYNARYFHGWARRTASYTRPLRPQHPWLGKLCRRSDEWIAPLLAADPTVIHGEFYSKTVLLRRTKIFPVDWESAAIAAGEIDLASLTEGTGWTAKMVNLCERAYQRARWPQGAPEDFQRTLDAARIYLHFRWLGERPDWTTREKTLWRYESLRAAATRLGLL